MDTKHLELTDGHIERLSDHLVEEADLRKLAIHGLNMTVSDLSKCQKNNKGNTAAFEVLRQWCRSQKNRIIAYDKLCDALKSAGMGLLISEVLEKGII